MKIIQSVKPSGTYVKFRFFQPYRLNGREYIPGEEMVCNDKLADYLSNKMLGAVMIEAPDPGVQVSVSGQIV